MKEVVSGAIISKLCGKKNKLAQSGSFNPRECVSAETVRKRIEWEKKLAIRQYEQSLDLKE